MSVLDRFLQYVKIDTQSAEGSETSPSTEKQLVLSRLLMEQMQALGLEDVRMDACGNVYGALPANCEGAPAVGLIAHIDTSDAVSGENVNPHIVEKYDGGVIELSPGITMSPEDFPELKSQVGEDLIVTDGTTLLGGDDKAGIAEILDAVERLKASGRKHGRVGIAFTTDEEVGRGTEGFDVPAFGCDFAYTVDGGELGEIVYETFNAANAVVRVQGRSVHPGSAKGVMRNACTILTELHSMLPREMTPECTEGYEGFLHLTGFKGSVESAEAHYILRDHDAKKLLEKKQLLLDAAATLNARYGAEVVQCDIRDSYCNMREYIEPHMHLITRAEAAFRSCGVEPVTRPIRGGTDGAALSMMGLPCPNLSTGGYQCHGIYEFVPVRALETMPLVLENLIYRFAEEKADV